MSFTFAGRELSARVMALRVPEAVPLAPALQERYLPPRGTMLIDEVLAKKEGLREGDQVRVGPVDLRVGKVQPRSAEAFQPFAFVNFDDAQAAFGSPGLVNFAMVILAPGASPDGAAARLEARLPEAQVFTKREFATAIRKEIDESFVPIIGILLAIGFTVGAAVVGLTTYTATIERSREFGVMKAVGASGPFLYRIVVSQSAMVTAAGFVVGLAAALLVARLARELVPDFATQFRLSDIVGVLIGTIVATFVASLVPVQRLNRIDPAVAFRA
jgi:putative ABC transport system permease protein